MNAFPNENEAPPDPDTPSGSDSQEQRIDAYLDDRMSPAEREAFEREVREDQTLSDLLSFQKRIDEGLQRQFGPASLPGPGFVPVRASEREEHFKFKWMKSPWAWAACLVLLLGGWLTVGGLLGGSTSLSETYRGVVAAGFEPGWVCETDTEFAQAYRKRLQLPLLLRHSTGVEAIGLSYGYAAGGGTVMLLARVEGQPVMVFAVKEEQLDTAPRANLGELHLFERRIDGVVLFEVTPNSSPAVLELFYRPQPDDPRLEVVPVAD